MIARKNSLAELRRYANSRLEPFTKIKLAIVGEENAGKTVLSHRLLGSHDRARESFDRRRETTGIHHHDVWYWREIEREIDGDGVGDGKSVSAAMELQVILWDYAGQHIYRQTHMSFFSEQAVYMLVFDMEKAKKDVDGLSHSARMLVDWVMTISSCVADPVFSIVGTRRDRFSDAGQAFETYRDVITLVHQKLRQHPKGSLYYRALCFYFTCKRKAISKFVLFLDALITYFHTILVPVQNSFNLSRGGVKKRNLSTFSRLFSPIVVLNAFATTKTVCCRPFPN
jgi:GTPase SAR1 family protein